MPFGLDIKSLIVGAILALYVWPLVMGFISNRSGNAKSAAA